MQIIVESTATIEQLHTKILHEGGFPIEQQSLVYEGNHLKSGTLADNVNRVSSRQRFWRLS